METSQKKTQTTETSMEEVACSVCYAPLNTSNCVATECKHHFCNTCFFKWLRESNRCPMCRNDYTNYTRRHYEQVNMNTVTDEFKQWQNLLGENRRMLKKKYDIQKEIHKLNENMIEKITRLKRLEETAEYNKGYQKAAYHMITEHDLYNAVYPGFASSNWQTGFQNGLKKKYDVDILSAFDYHPDPLVASYKRRIYYLLKNGDIKREKFDVFNTNESLCEYVYHTLKTYPLHDVSMLFNDNSDGMENNEHELHLTHYNTIHRKDWNFRKALFVDFIIEYGKNVSVYKSPYYIDNDNNIVYYPFDNRLYELDNYEFNNAMNRMRNLSIHSYHHDTSITSSKWKEATDEQMNARVIVQPRRRNI